MDLIAASSPLNFERYELKYPIPLSLVKPIGDYVSRFCVLDPYCQGDTFSYLINTLYLDSRNYTFYHRRVNGEDRRFTMRIRSYGANPKPPYFVEIKYKQNGVVRKFRYPVDTATLAQLTDSRWLAHIPDYAGKKNFELFVRQAVLYDVEPKVFTQYRRQAWVSTIDEYARVTFDRSLKCVARDGYDLAPCDRLARYDNPNIFPSDEDNVVLELKSTTQVPLWLLDLITIFDLKRVSFSKYCNSLEYARPEFIPRMERITNVGDLVD